MNAIERMLLAELLRKIFTRRGVQSAVLVLELDNGTALMHMPKGDVIAPDAISTTITTLIADVLKTAQEAAGVADGPVIPDVTFMKTYTFDEGDMPY